MWTPTVRAMVFANQAAAGPFSAHSEEARAKVQAVGQAQQSDQESDPAQKSNLLQSVEFIGCFEDAGQCVCNSGHGDLLPHSLDPARLWRLPQAGARRLQDTLSFAYEIHYFRFATQKSDVIELTNEQINEIAGKTATESR